MKKLDLTPDERLERRRAQRRAYNARNRRPVRKMEPTLKLKHPQMDGDGQSLSCVECGSMRLRVTATRHHAGTIRRRRKCLGCGVGFNTMEVVCDVHCRPIMKGERP